MKDSLFRLDVDEIPSYAVKLETFFGFGIKLITWFALSRIENLEALYKLIQQFPLIESLSIYEWHAYDSWYQISVSDDSLIICEQSQLARIY